jgi:hypothetical protein
MVAIDATAITARATAQARMARKSPRLRTGLREHAEQVWLFTTGKPRLHRA